MPLTLSEVIERMPMTWSCIKCCGEFPNRPDAETPWGIVQRLDHEKRCVVVDGYVCRACSE